MTTIQTFTCRFQPMFRQQPPGLTYPSLTKYIATVKWWAYDDDRLDGRGDAKMTKAYVEVKAYSLQEARKLVTRDWGRSAAIGTIVEVAA
jgi:hypothetical protein